MRCKIERTDVGDDAVRGLLEWVDGLGWAHRGLGGWHTIKGTRLRRLRDGTFVVLGSVSKVPVIVTVNPERIPLLPARRNNRIGVPSLPAVRFGGSSRNGGRGE